MSINVLDWRRRNYKNLILLREALKEANFRDFDHYLIFLNYY